jgi:hypothetical protein
MLVSWDIGGLIIPVNLAFHAVLIIIPDENCTSESPPVDWIIIGTRMFHELYSKFKLFVHTRYHVVVLFILLQLRIYHHEMSWFVIVFTSLVQDNIIYSESDFLIIYVLELVVHP